MSLHDILALFQNDICSITIQWGTVLKYCNGGNSAQWQKLVQYFDFPFCLDEEMIKSMGVHWFICNMEWIGWELNWE